MKENDFREIEELIIQKHLSNLKNPENGVAKAMTETAAKLAVLAIREYHQKIQGNPKGDE
ncbi:hypothetical protein [Brevibacillus brevis]|uniref:hypothetical protein n=1 Tax=Brevibacillus brevis TaxID=1393 RepID=UPI0037C948D1